MKDILPYDDHQKRELDTLRPYPWNPAIVDHMIEALRWQLIRTSSNQDILDILDGFTACIRKIYSILPEGIHDGERIIGVGTDLASQRLRQIVRKEHELN